MRVDKWWKNVQNFQNVFSGSTITTITKQNKVFFHSTGIIICLYLIQIMCFCDFNWLYYSHFQSYSYVNKARNIYIRKQWTESERLFPAASSTNVILLVICNAVVMIHNRRGTRVKFTIPSLAVIILSYSRLRIAKPSQAAWLGQVSVAYVTGRLPSEVELLSRMIRAAGAAS